MKNVIIVYSKMVIGGSTTSLLSLLNCLDYTRYSVDLQLYDNHGELQDQINKNVNILPEMSQQSKKIHKYIRPSYWTSLVKARVYSTRMENRLINAQYMSKYEAIACPKSGKQYDVGISFLEFWPMEYLVRRVNATRKIGWIHIDIKEAGLFPIIGDELYSKLDKIVLVSNSCVENMKMLYPSQAERLVCIENILVSDTIEGMAKQTPEVEYTVGVFNFVTACRLVLASKGLDRGINAFGKLKKEGIIHDGIKWFIIGDGPDRQIIEQMIKEQGLTNNILLLGQQKNPYCIEKDMNVFLLPSRYEGKPMAVTEAQMLGLVPVVCNYSSANEQINDGVDGLIANNDDEDIYYKIRQIITDTEVYATMRETVVSNEYSNIHVVDSIQALME